MLGFEQQPNPTKRKAKTFGTGDNREPFLLVHFFWNVFHQSSIAKQGFYGILYAMDEFQILLFYKYVHIEDPAAARDWVFALCSKYNLKGRLIVAAEGINFTFEGKTADTEAFLVEMQNDKRYGTMLQNIHFKRSVGTGTAFPKLSVKVREEIVTGNLGVCDIDPNEVTGKHLPPTELHEWIHSGKEFYIVDMRNAYEHKVGKFAGSICPPLENFRDLPKIIKSIAHLKNKTVVTVCTGEYVAKRPVVI